MNVFDTLVVGYARNGGQLVTRLKKKICGFVLGVEKGKNSKKMRILQSINLLNQLDLQGTMSTHL